MPYRICKIFEIESGHMLSKHPDLCRFPHGHSRKVELVLEAAELDRNEMVCDFKAVKDAVGEYLQSFDHALCVNTQDKNFKKLQAAYGKQIIAFADRDPTTEVMARVIFDAAQKRLAAYAARPRAKYPLARGVRLVRVRVWETSTSWAEYEA
ncbi:MAG TPA: 6-carboxytetrahydropterin synthase [Opitutales bacterium]|nr:6-carboxytetrahydropterin synthase [Opitutales bacterium]